MVMHTHGVLLQVLGSDETITEATFTLSDINNWKIETEYSYIHLLDNCSPWS